MKRITSLFVCFALLGLSVLAQDVQITGKVTNAEDGSLLPGVSVVVKGTTTGTTTDINGEYTITAPSDATLEFSFIGMKTKEVALAGQTTLDVTLEMDITGLEEVVVTALGITREKKSLGYSVSEVKGEELEKTQVVDATRALQGKVAGVNISSSSGAPGASTRVIIRGISSLTASNQPLYVINGVPVNNDFANANSTQPETTVNRTVDFGNAASDINPSDIESINVLKGAAATSLYGSRAANGVVIITTKSGMKNQDMRVNLTASSTIQDVGRLPYYQDQFGQGWNGHYDSRENGSWGPLLDGKDRLIGYPVDNSSRVMPFKYYENSLRDFYEYGLSTQVGLSLSGGTDKIGYYAGYTNTSQDGIVPGEADLLKRHSFTFKGNGGTDKTKIEFSTNYTNKKISALATGQGDDAGGGKTLYQEILQNPVNHYIPTYRDYNNKFDNLDNFYTPYAQNPYFIINENGNDYRQNRLVSSLKLTRKIIEGLDVSWRGGMDYMTDFYKDYGAIAKLSPDSPNKPEAKDVVGLTKEEAKTNTQLNSDLFINFTNKVGLASGVLNYKVTLGNNVNQRHFKRLTTISRGLVVPEFYNIQNISGTPDVSTYEELRRLIGVFGMLSLDFDGMLFLELTARNDWSSTLPKGKNSFFYPGVNLGFVFTELMASKDIVTFGKVRASYAYAGNDADPYQIKSNYDVASVRAGGFGLTNYPINGYSAFEKRDVLGNPNLKPEISKEFEIGADVRFLDNRIGLDAAYYNKITTDLIFLATIASSSGYYWKTVNLGQITNQGIEIKLDLTPVRMSNFTWDLSFIFTQGTTVLDKLSEELGVEEYQINSAYEAEFMAIPGEEIGQYRVPDYSYSPDGKIIVGSNGLPVEGGKRLMGSAIPDYNWSIINNLRYKDLSLSFLFDYQKGGYMYSYTADITYWSGNNEQSVINDRKPWVIPNTVQEVEDANGNITYVENHTPVHNNWHEYYSSNTNKPIEEEQIIERTYLKLREVSLNYSIPSSLVQKVRLQGAIISLYGRNLFLWTPADNSFIDPESSTWGNDLMGMFGEFGGAPSVRSYGIKLNLTF